MAVIDLRSLSILNCLIILLYSIGEHQNNLKFLLEVLQEVC